MSDSKKVSLEFIHIPEDRSREVGTFPFVQITYSHVRVGEDGDIFIADFDRETGLWVDENGDEWTDVSVVPA